MSIVVPPLPLADHLYNDQFSKLTGHAATTWYTSHALTNVRLVEYYFKQDNTTPQADNMHVRITCDGVVYTVGPAAIADNTPYYTGLDPRSTPDVGEVPELSLQNAMQLLTTFVSEDQGAAEVRGIIPIGGQVVTIEYYFATIGANQEFYADATYFKREPTTL